MSTVKKGVLTSSREWAKHLRPWGRRRFWSAERVAGRVEIREQLAGSFHPAELRVILEAEDGVRG